MIIEFDNGKLEDIKSEGIKIVDFYATWCGPCKMMAVVFEDLVKENPDVTVVKVNVDNHPELASQYGVMSIPTVFLYKDNNETSKFIGFRDLEDIKALIKS